MTFVSQYNGSRNRPIPFGVSLFCIATRTDYPNVTFFQLLYQSDEIGHPSDRHVLERSGGSFCNHLSETNCSTLGYKNPMNSGAFSSSQYGTHVTRILESV